ncbi:alpha/beta fold hydrolase [Nocardioides campestrisoli]|uniref:alpha/beta fold hydrolase n=1 Tax=Nocardioides campestrisoli TaxID=2736757 RepID=UPI00163DAC4A|nr:alpha/beta hydrolase [Nocardioides campestrisoli]
MRLLFIHGAGGFLDDQPMAEGLHTSLGVPVEMPRLPEEDMSVEGWAAPIRRHLRTLGPDDVAVGHSFGATILQWVLSEADWAPPRAVLLAMPDWSPDGWDVPDYAHRGPEPATALSIHHCRDDEEVPFDHLRLHAARLPSARIVPHDEGGHQFEGRLAHLADDLRRPG